MKKHLWGTGKAWHDIRVETNDLALPQSPEALRELALRLYVERYEARRAAGAAIEASIAAARQVAELRTAIKRKDAEYAELRRLIFGKSSEKSEPSDERQGELFNEAERDAVDTAGTTRPQRGGEVLPLLREARPRIGEERSDELEIIPTKAVVIEHVRPKIRAL